MKKVEAAYGDLRMKYLAKMLGQNGYGITMGESFSPERMQKADVVILPVPVTHGDNKISWGMDGSAITTDEICNCIRKGQSVFGGVIPKDMKSTLEAQGAFCYDFMEMIDIAMNNAVATAEGAIAEAIIAGKNNLTGSNCLVIGYGKCGLELAGKLQNFGANVTVMARRSTIRQQARVKGFAAVMPGEIYGTYSYVFNTVPARMLGEKELARLPLDVCIIDIASNPGGTDFAWCEEHGVKAKLCLGLPGKYSPKTSGEILARAVLDIMEV